MGVPVLQDAIIKRQLPVQWSNRFAPRLVGCILNLSRLLDQQSHAQKYSHCCGDLSLLQHRGETLQNLDSNLTSSWFTERNFTSKTSSFGPLAVWAQTNKV
mmetsp:Transcript_8947/g.28428  ORF Transcript_8947/g.28428 Transcript_8947/m.28428 type:complete len:101 (-) Transcript_8947:670-972(-)